MSKDVSDGFSQGVAFIFGECDLLLTFGTGHTSFRWDLVLGARVFFHRFQ